jgi:hypothetical protein
MDPVTVLAAFGPLVVDLGKSLISRFVAPDEMKPANVGEYIQMRQCDLEMFKAMNEAGGSNQSYQWVEAIVRLQRPAVAAIALATWAYLQISGTPNDAVENFAAAIGFYLFGDRTLFYAKKTPIKG